VGALFVLIPRTLYDFVAYVLDSEDEIEEVQAALVPVFEKTGAIYSADEAELRETEDECVDRLFREFTAALTEDQLPEGRVLSEKARSALNACARALREKPIDVQLLAWMKAEYGLFRMVERKVFQPRVARLFTSLDDFLETAMSIIQARRSRAGRSLENHVEQVLTDARIPFEMRMVVDGTRPDVLIPGKAAYQDPDYPVERLVAMGVKTTCKDRWRQVVNEAPRVPRKHILTTQEGISSPQLAEMEARNVQLVVPKPLHSQYPPDRRGTILDVQEFIGFVRRLLAP
jgi:EcoRII C terminal